MKISIEAVEAQALGKNGRQVKLSLSQKLMGFFLVSPPPHLTIMYFVQVFKKFHPHLV